MHKTVFLVGYMGAGKTTIGKKISKAMNKSFVDLDHHLVSEVEMSIPEYFSTHGEAAFRQKESEVLRNIPLQGQIISTGGGTPCFSENIDYMLASGIVVYLKLTPKALYSRLAASDVRKRPALKGLEGDQLLKHIEDTLAQREAFYNRAQISIDPVSVPLSQIIQAIENV